MLFPSQPERWLVSGAWLRQTHACGLAWIQSTCGGMCCHHPTYWPPSSGRAQGLTHCPHLGRAGCELGSARPITCHLYPLRLVRGKLVGHAPAMSSRARPCKGAHHPGAPMLVDTLATSLRHLFGAEQYERVREDVLAGRDSYFEVSSELAAAYAAEQEWEAAGGPPQPHSL